LKNCIGIIITCFFFICCPNLYSLNQKSEYSVGKEKVDALLSQAVFQKLWEQSYWLKLLFYQQADKQIKNSIVKDQAFFISPDGQSDPKVELIASIKSFFLPPNADENEHPQCKFKARFNWLKTKLPFDKTQLPRVNCDKYHEWMTEIDSYSLTLIFPNYSFNALESSFGHLFLRVDSDARKENYILNYTINYAALLTPDDKAGKLTYFFKGIFGGFTGYYTVIPYYLKIKEYGGLENRDIWEYELNFTKEETSRLLNHIWELQNIGFDYYFFKENCSYQILKLLEIARPGLSINSDFFLWSIPSDSLKTVKKSDLIKNRKYRASPKSRIYQHLALLDGQAEDIFYKVLDNPKTLDSNIWYSLDKRQKAIVLESYIEYLGLGRLNLNLKRQLPYLKKRAALDYKSEYTDLDQLSTPPDEGSDSSAIRMSYGKHDILDSYSELSIQASYHSFMDNDNGFFPDSEIELLKLRIRNYKDQESTLEELTIISMFSLLPYDSISQPISKKMKIGIERYPEQDCLNCMMGYFRYGYGITTKWGNMLFYFLPELAINHGSKFQDNYQAGIGIDTGIAYSFDYNTKIHLNLNQDAYHWGEKKETRKVLFQFRQNFSTNSDMHINLIQMNEIKDYGIGFSYFF
jgi:hypothetical protein